MGKRVHVVKKQEEYGSSEYFNWEWSSFNSCLGELGCDVCCNDDEFNDRFECDIDQYKRALKLLKAYKKKGMTESVIRQFDACDANIEIDYVLDQLGGIDNVLKAMESFYKERDKKSNYIQFVAF